jgi:uncharacterized protein YgfB (UPF0149 family)
MTHIGRATVEVGVGSEEEEEAYAEVVEYVRVGVQLIHDELGDVRSEDLLADASGEPEEDDDDTTDPPVRH